MICINTYLVIYVTLPYEEIKYRVKADTEDEATDKMIDKLLMTNVIENYSVGYINDEINVYRLDDLEIIE